MSTPPFIPSGPLPSFQSFLSSEEERVDAELRVAHGPRMSVAAPRGDELPETLTTETISVQEDGLESSSPRGTATDTPGACATRHSDSALKL